MFTRVPTFIPTSSANNETRNTTVKSRSVETEEVTRIAATREPVLRRIRKRTKTTRKRLPTKNSEVNVGNRLPVIGKNSNRVSAEENLPTPSYQRESRKSKIMAKNCAKSAMLLSPVVTRRTLARERSEMCGRKMDEQAADSPVNDVEQSDKMITEESYIIDAEMLTHARLYKRNRRKFIEDNHYDIQTKRHARNDCGDLETRKTVGNNKAKAISSSNRFHRYEVEGARPFRSKIPVRFPEIQENKRNLQGTFPQVLSKPDISLPPIDDDWKNTRQASNSEQVTQSIQDCRNMLEKDFQRLGKNLENTFKLLHRYIEGTASSVE